MISYDIRPLCVSSFKLDNHNRIWICCLIPICVSITTCIQFFRIPFRGRTLDCSITLDVLTLNSFFFFFCVSRYFPRRRFLGFQYFVACHNVCTILMNRQYNTLMSHSISKYSLNNISINSIVIYMYKGRVKQLIIKHRRTRRI